MQSEADADSPQPRWLAIEPKSVYRKTRVTIKATPAQNIVLKAIESASPEIAARWLSSMRSYSSSNQVCRGPLSPEPGFSKPGFSKRETGAFQES